MRQVRYFCCGMLLVLGIHTGVATAQAPIAATPAVPRQSIPTYDISTIKPNLSGTGKWDIWTGDSTWRAANISARSSLWAAFGIDENLIFGLPSWTDKVRYDIYAKISEASPEEITALSVEQRRQMLQALLTERFGLRTHFEQREESGFELVLRQPPQSAPGLRRSTETSAAGLQAARNKQRVGTHLFVQRQVEMAALVVDLSAYLRQPVIDSTGLKGDWDIDLSWLRDGESPSVAPDIPADIFTAVREQLGLELRKSRASLPVLVVDQWLPPTQN